MNDKRDEKIIQMFQARDEGAIKAAEDRYRGFCLSVLSNLLTIKEDREECINDALLALWNTIPPEHPKSLSAYLAKIVRNLAFKRSREENAWKRGGRVVTVRDELLADISDSRTLADDYQSALAGRLINEFLDGLPEKHRKVFIMRYWFGEDLECIAQRTGRSAAGTAQLLKRLRDKLKVKLVKEGILDE